MSFPTADEVMRERFGFPILEEVCERCGAPVRRIESGFAVHTRPTPDCAVPTVFVREVRA